MTVGEIKKLIEKELADENLTINSSIVKFNAFNGKVSEVNFIVQFLVEMPNKTATWVSKEAYAVHPYWSKGRIMQRRLKATF
jgi:hypothetical protein